MKMKIEVVRKRGSNEPTECETAVLMLIAEGRTNIEIGGILGISPKTVEKHRANLMKKLNLHCVAHLVHYAISKGIVEVIHFEGRG